MTRIGGLLIVFILTSVCAKAQTFTDHARKQSNGGGRLTVVQDADLDNIVNNKKGRLFKQPKQQRKLKLSRLQIQQNQPRSLHQPLAVVVRVKVIAM